MCDIILFAKETKIKQTWIDVFSKSQIDEWFTEYISFHYKDCDEIYLISQDNATWFEI